MRFILGPIAEQVGSNALANTEIGSILDLEQLEEWKASNESELQQLPRKGGKAPLRVIHGII